MASHSFDYQTAFKRNLGLISPQQQKCLQTSRIAIAGLGGMGGAEANALVRMGVGRFTLADLDFYELTNFNRQLGATIQTIGLSKVETTRQQILSVNPDAEVRLIPEGLNPQTIAEFLADADLVIDALDFTCFKERFLLYRKCRKLNLWIINCAPPGFGSSILLFDPKGMSFEEYFDFNENTTPSQLSFAQTHGVTPSSFMLKYIDKTIFQVSSTRPQLPCASPAFFIGAGIVALETLCLLTGQSHMCPVPTVYEFDAYLHKYKKSYHWLGMRHPWHRLIRWVISNFVLKDSAQGKQD